MGKFDIGKVLNNLEGKVDIGFVDDTDILPEKYWGIPVGTGSYAINYLLSRRFDRAYQFGVHYLFAGDSGSGKSLMAATACKTIQQSHDAVVLWIDSENANDGEEGERWFQRAGVDTSPDRFHYLPVDRIDQMLAVVSQVSKSMRDTPQEDRVPIVLVIDSWMRLITENQEDKYNRGEIAHDQGQRAKQIKDAMAALLSHIRRLPILAIGVTHQYEVKPMYGATKKVTSGGQGLIYYSQGAVQMDKRKLTLSDIEDDAIKNLFEEEREGALKEVLKQYGGDNPIAGIIADVSTLKARQSFFGLKTTIQIPYNVGVDPYSGLFEILMQRGTIRKGGRGWLEYTDVDGTTKSFRRSELRENGCELYHKLMEIQQSNEG